MACRLKSTDFKELEVYLCIIRYLQASSKIFAYIWRLGKGKETTPPGFILSQSSIEAYIWYTHRIFQLEYRTGQCISNLHSFPQKNKQTHWTIFASLKRHWGIIIWFQVFTANDCTDLGNKHFKFVLFYFMQICKLVCFLDMLG